MTLSEGSLGVRLKLVSLHSKTIAYFVPDERTTEKLPTADWRAYWGMRRTLNRPPV